MDRVPASAEQPAAAQRTLVLGSGVARAIREHARQAYPDECCGALMGSRGIASAVLPLPNVTKDGPRRRFLVQASDYRAAEARAQELRAELVGFYHSHPDHPARPSRYDLEHAWPVFAYVIVSVRQGEPMEMTCWRLKDDRSAFEQERLDGADD